MIHESPVCRIRISDRAFQTSSAPARFFLLKKRAARDTPLTPAEGTATTAWGSSGEDSVQTAQHRQVKARTVKHPAANTFLGFPSEGKLRPQAVMRCSAIARYEAYCYFFRLKTVPLAEPTPQSAVVPQAELPDTFPSEGKAERTTFARIRKLSPLCTQPLSLASPVLPVLRGVSGGGAALSSLCRRFPGGDIMNLTSRRSPLSVLSWQSRSLHEQRMA